MKKSESGFTMIELMVSVAIGSIVMLVLILVFVNWYRHIRTTDVNLAINDFVTEVKYMMRNPTVCTATFSGIAFDITTELDSQSVIKPVSSLKKGIGSGGAEDWISIDEQIKDGVKLTAIGLTQLSVIDVSHGRFRGFIKLKFTRGEGTPGSSTHIIILPLQLDVSMDANTATVVSCSAGLTASGTPERATRARADEVQ